jgi:hypothetical protein
MVQKIPIKPNTSNFDSIVDYSNKLPDNSYGNVRPHRVPTDLPGHHFTGTGGSGSDGYDWETIFLFLGSILLGSYLFYRDFMKLKKKNSSKETDNSSKETDNSSKETDNSSNEQNLKSTDSD